MKQAVSLPVMMGGLAALFTASPLLGEAASGGGPLEVNGGLVIWTLVVFAMLFYVLKRHVWPVILGAVEAREKRLLEQLAEAERNRAASAALLAEHQKLLDQSRLQAQGILAEAKIASEKERALAVQKTRDEQDQLLARARREIVAEGEKARQELRKEAVDLSLAAASKLIGERLSAEADKKIVMDFLRTLESSH